MEKTPKKSAKTKLLELFVANVGIEIDKETLARVAEVYDWPRNIRTLRQEGYKINVLKNGSYVLESSEISPLGNKRESIDGKTRYRILQRDQSKCQRCGKSVIDGVKLHIDHKIPVNMGGDKSDNNLWTLCEECNLGKQSWFSDEDADIMKEVLAVESGYKRLEKYFKLNPNKFIEPAKLEVISGIRDWTRTVRLIRKNEEMDIRYTKDKFKNDGYIYSPSK